jgi:hypothetical protein
MTTEEQKRLEELQECVNRTAIFLNDIFPQLKNACIQDFHNLNQLATLVSNHSQRNNTDTRY